MRTTYNYEGRHPGGVIEEAKRVVAIATEAEDLALGRALQKVRSRILEPGTCAHPKKQLSMATKERNDFLEEIADEIENLKADPLPF